MSLAQIELWALRALAVLAVLGLATWRIFAAGEAHVQAKWDAQKAIDKTAVEVQNAKNELDTRNRQNDVLLAEADAAKAHRDLIAYRSTHPITASMLSGLCPESLGDTANACKGAGDLKAVTACKTQRLLQQQTALDSKAKQLDELMAEADEENEDYAVCLATRPRQWLPVPTP